MTRTEFLKEATLNVVHKKARIAMPADWSVKDLPESLQEELRQGKGFDSVEELERWLENAES